MSVASFTNIFSIGCLFVLFMVSFAVQKLVNGLNCLLLLLFLLPWDTDLGKHWYDLCQNVLPTFSSRSFMLSCLIF